MGLLGFGAKCLGINKITEQWSENIRDMVKEHLQEFATGVVSKVEPETINEKLDNVEVEANLDAEEQSRREENVESLKGVLEVAGGEDGSYDNIIEAIDQEPEKWGQVTKNLDAETLENMQTSLENGEKLDAFDAIKLAYGAGSSAVSNFTEKYSEPSSEEEVEATAETETKAEAEANTGAAAGLDVTESISSSECESSDDYEFGA